MRGVWSNFAHITDMLSTHTNVDIFSVSETHIANEPGELYNIEGYHFIYRNRQKGKGGGVAFYLNERLDWQI